MTSPHLGPEAASSSMPCTQIISDLNIRYENPAERKSHIRTLQGVSNGLLHTTYRLPDRAPRKRRVLVVEALSFNVDEALSFGSPAVNAAVEENTGSLGSDIRSKARTPESAESHWDPSADLTG